MQKNKNEGSYSHLMKPLLKNVYPFNAIDMYVHWMLIWKETYEIMLT